MRYTVPWVPSPPTREPSDDDELGATAIRLGCLVGYLARVAGRPLAHGQLETALDGLFGNTPLDDDGRVQLIASSILMARAFGLIELTPRGWVSTS